MNILLILFSFSFLTNKIANLNIGNKINEYLKLPIWYVPNIPCERDDECPILYACCHDAFFPIKDKYCCRNYKKREYKYAYVYSK